MIEAEHRPDHFSVAAAVLGALQLALAGYIWRYGPSGRLPMHFALDGSVNRWGSRYEVVILLAVMAALSVGIDMAIVWRMRRAGLTPAESRTSAVGRFIGLFVMGSMTILVAALGLGKLTPGPAQVANMHLLFALLWLIFAVTGALVGKAAPNRFVGVRVYWTFHSRLAWDKANRLLGRIYFLGGLAGLAATPFVDVRQTVILLMAVALGGGVLAVFESWRVWRADPERT